MRSLMDSKSIRRFKREVKVHQFINTSYMALITLVFVLINLALYTLVAWAAWLVVVVNHFGGTPLTTPESIILGVAVMLTFGRYVSGEKAKGIFLFWRVRS